MDHAIHSADLLVCIGLDPVEYPLGKLTDEARIDALSLSDTSVPRDAGWHLGAEAVGDLAAGLRHTACETDDDLAKHCGDRPARQLITVPVKYSGTFA
ncbi:hypothetical protein N0B44_28700 [Roseibacterium beibuensis]|uniref:Thiamine pyrophosphate enzyme central domain-containing protein n=1 Tax=[Roseibacterium] beibuensis TaxID=1193142 RepID=A0ABP9LL35_9RHOB|nr:hypothetical protein [Roseibacterium beibuensis]MCS6626903.1 hypothetical protein [Roseibacterium beibuensis]